MAAKQNATEKKTPARSGAKPKGKSAPRKAAKPTRAAARVEAEQKPQQPVMSRTAYGVLSLALGVLFLLALLPVDGFVLAALHKGVGALLGGGAYILPFALFALSILLFHQLKGPVRLRAVAILALPLLCGAIAHAFAHANEFGFTMASISELLETGMEGDSGGLLAGGLYVVMEWALSSVGALVILLLLTIVCVLGALRVTPAALRDMLTPPEYEYDDEEERARYEAPPKLPNVHEVAAEVAAARAEKRQRRKMEIDIPLDPDPPPPPVLGDGEPAKRGPVIAPDEYIKKVMKNAVPVQMDNSEDPDAFLNLVQGLPKAEPEDGAEPPAEPAPKPAKPEKLSEAEQAAMAAQMDESQKAPVPVYDYPSLDLLKPAKPTSARGAEQELKENSAVLTDTLQSFGVEAQIIGIVRGPSVTRFELTIPRGIKISRITALSDDIALSLGATSVRIAPIPDKVAVGVEVPNKTTSVVSIRECIGSPSFSSARSRLSFAVGKDITGQPVIGDIAKMPHMLIAGTTGSGKSVCINSMLISLLYKSTPEEVRLIMVDPKMVELGNYNGIPHLLIPVVTDPKKAAGALGWAVGEMERRYKLFADHQVRNLSGYNDLMRASRQQELLQEGGNPDQYQVLPQIVIVIDELADLMMVAAKEVETSICRIAQKARAAGMHLIVATQRPSADVITGIMKANIPSRIAFAVASQIESRIILDTTGAEKLIGKGDMLYAPLGEGKPTRIQGCFISSDEIEAVIAKIKETSTAEYSEEILEHIERHAEQQESGSSSGNAGEDEDELLFDAIDVVMDCKQASTSMLQRRLKLGYARAARIIDQIEERGIIGPYEGSKPRQILITREQWQEMKLRRTDMP